MKGGLLGTIVGAIGGALFGKDIGIAGSFGGINGGIPGAIIGAAIGGLVGDKVEQNTTDHKVILDDNTPFELSPAEQYLFSAINNARASMGLNTLICDDKLAKVARIKAFDMERVGYVSFESPWLGNLKTMLDGAKYSYQYAFMGVGVGLNTTDFELERWLRSELWKELSCSTYKYIGVGYAPTSTYFAVIISY